MHYFIEKIYINRYLDWLLAFLIVSSSEIGINSLFIYIAALFFIFINKTYIDKSSLKCIIPLAAVVFIGFINISGINYYVFKDIFYFTKPIIIFITGSIFCSKYKDILKINKNFIYFSLFIVLIAFYRYVFLVGFKFSEIIENKNIKYHGNLIMVYSLIFILFLNFKFSILTKVFMLFSLLFFPFISLSRTIVLNLLIFIFLILIIEKISLKKIVSVLILVFFIFYGLIYLNKYEGIKYIINEIIPNQNYYSIASNYTNWRGYETYIGYDKYRSYKSLEKYLMGGGLGTIVDVNFIWFEGEGFVLDYIPIFHNGYIYLLLKTGIIGLFCYIAFFIYIAYKGLRILKKEIRFEQQFFLGLIITSIFNTFVISGLYNKTACDGTILLMGLYFRYINNKLKLWQNN